MTRVCPAPVSVLCGRLSREYCKWEFTYLCKRLIDGRGLYALQVWTTYDTCEPITYPKKELRQGDREMLPALRGSEPDVVVGGWLVTTCDSVGH